MTGKNWHTTTSRASVSESLGDLPMNPAVLTRLDQLEQEWQKRLLMQPSSAQAGKKEGVLATPPHLPRSRPEGLEEMIRQPLQR